MAKLRFRDCGGDFVAAGASVDDVAGFGGPRQWHRDHQCYLQRFCASVLAGATDLAQGPLLLESWSSSEGRVYFMGQPGLLAIRDARALRRGSRTDARLPRSIPSFRFGAGNAAEASFSMSLPELWNFSVLDAAMSSSLGWPRVRTAIRCVCAFVLPWPHMWPTCSSCEFLALDVASV